MNHMWVIQEKDGPATIFYLTNGKNKIELDRWHDLSENKGHRMENEYNKQINLIEAMMNLEAME